jgi:hypothetical protein
MSDIIRYNAASASQNVYDDCDEIYNDFSGLDIDEMNVEFSDASGNFLRRNNTRAKFNTNTLPQENTKKFQKGALRGIIDNRRSGLEDRLLGREQNISERQGRKTLRSDARVRRGNLRQISMLENNPPIVTENIVKIVSANTTTAPTLNQSLEATSIGEANSIQEQQAQVVIQEANKMIQAGITEAPIIELNSSGVVIEVKDTWWKKQPKGVRISIILGGIALLGIGTYAIIKAKNKK